MSHSSQPPSPWVDRFASFIPKGGIVLDLACGSGRHTRSLSKMGYRILAVDIDVSRMADFAANENIEIVEADWAEGKARGVMGSPHFFTPGGDFFCPALDVRRVDGHLRITADPEGFDRFLESCLGA